MAFTGPDCSAAEQTMAHADPSMPGGGLLEGCRSWLSGCQGLLWGWTAAPEPPLQQYLRVCNLRRSERATTPSRQIGLTAQTPVIM